MPRTDFRTSIKFASTLANNLSGSMPVGMM